MPIFGNQNIKICNIMSNKTKRYLLPEEEIPHYWYNIQADMANKPMPPLHPGTKQPLKAEDLFPIFAEELSRQELNQTDAWIEIPEEVREMYKYYRSTPPVSYTHLDVYKRQPYCILQRKVGLFHV